MSGPIPCKKCGADRVRRWRATRAMNGLTEAEWPKPKAPLFEDAVALAQHDQAVHR